MEPEVGLDDPYGSLTAWDILSFHEMQKMVEWAEYLGLILEEVKGKVLELPDVQLSEKNIHKVMKYRNSL